MKRLPTIDEWKELQENCSWEWDDNKKGMTVTGPSGKSIFLPAAGFRYYTDLYDAGSNGYYWSSSLNTDYTFFAWLIFFCSNDVIRGIYFNHLGLSVRPVSETKEEDFVDLGLPSGLFWSEKNIEGLYTYDEAMNLFERNRHDAGRKTTTP